MKLIRVVHHFDRWEGYRAGMWKICSSVQVEEMLPDAIKITGDHKLYGEWMRKVPAAWPVETEHNLTDVTLNRKAWLGHAACFIARQIPEEIVRRAWSYLSDRQRYLANRQAERVIVKWEREYLGQQYQQLPFPWGGYHA